MTAEWETLPELAAMLAELTRERSRLLAEFDRSWDGQKHQPTEGETDD